MTNIHFGTDGWRAIIGSDFTEENLIKVVRAAAYCFLEKEGKGRLYIGHDCRLDAHRYAEIAAEEASKFGFDVILTSDYCPTPTLCWSVAHDDMAVGGIMLTSSHNAAEYLGIKLRMRDGGASPAEFTDRVEQILESSTTFEESQGSVTVSDLMPPYIDSLLSFVDVDVIKKSNLRIVLDPLFGASRGYLGKILKDLGLEVVQINNAEDPTFDGLHPEPVPPWVDRGLTKIKDLGYDALFTNDGDADRISAGDKYGNFVNPHKILILVTQHLYNKGLIGRVVSTYTASALLTRLCNNLGLEFCATPVGFKWIYAEMKKGDVLVGGEESGGIGIPSHVMERDGLLMALLLTEMMAQTGKDLAQLVADLENDLGHMEFTRIGLSITNEKMDNFKNNLVPNLQEEEICNLKVVGTNRLDGIKFTLENDGWVMMRPSGTEPLVRIYAEAENNNQVESLLDWAKKKILG